MTRNGNRASFAWPLGVGDATALVVLGFDDRGRVVEVAAKRLPPQQESAADKAAADLVQQLGAKLGRIGSLQEARDRAQLALHLLEDLIALEEMHGDEARALFPRAPGGAA
ncbi:hypothetical protein UFOVP99_3 [uncultured Caudovirales phage]|uniref:Uncharacterized protein n=1 Tax=uncultured Caudovirales phage TaxID=2100421 RepID=A0A6J5KZQ6_9CAUD|nr:hypothetical protein UFOVP99_3 [uncultured Caudovirales phage]